MSGRSTAHEMFEALRARSASGSLASFDHGSAADRAVVIRRDTRPQMVGVLTSAASLLEGWLSEHHDLCGLRVPDARGLPLTLTRDELAARLRGGPDVFFQAVASAQAATFMTAYLALHQSAPMSAFVESQCPFARRMNPIIAAASLYRETMPGLCVSSGLGYVVSRLVPPSSDSERRRARCRALVEDSAWIAMEWASQSQVGFACLFHQLGWGSPNNPRINPLREVNALMNDAARALPELADIIGEPDSEAQEEAIWLLKPWDFTITDVDGRESLTIDPLICARIPALWSEIARHEYGVSSPYRNNCPAFGMKIAGHGFVEHSAIWTALIMDRFWDVIEW